MTKRHLPGWVSVSIIAFGLALLAVPIYLLVDTYRRIPVEDALPVEPTDVRLEELPTEAVYPSTDELQAEAAVLSEELRSRFPKSASAFHIAANLSAQLRQYEDAEKYWKRSLELNSDFAGPRGGLALALLEQGREAEALPVLRGAYDDGFRSVDIFRLWTQASQRAGDYEEAEKVCREGLERYPEDIELLLEYGKLKIQANELEIAKGTLEKVIALQPGATPAYQSLATVAARLGDETKSSEYRAKFEQLRDENSLKDVEFTDLYRASLQRIVVESLMNAATEYQRNDQEDIAERLLLRSLALSPENLQACYSLVQMFREQGRIDDAYMVQKRIVDIEPSAKGLINLASLAIPLERFKVAEAALLAAADLEPQNPAARRGLGVLYQSVGQFEAAEAQTLELIKLDPAAANYELLAQIRLLRGDQQGYTQALAKAREGNP